MNRSFLKWLVVTRRSHGVPDYRPGRKEIDLDALPVGLAVTGFPRTAIGKKALGKPAKDLTISELPVPTHSAPRSGLANRKPMVIPAAQSQSRPVPEARQDQAPVFGQEPVPAQAMPEPRLIYSLRVADIRPSHEKLSFSGESLATLWGVERMFSVDHSELPFFDIGPNL